jgi:hypothetical protein
MPERSPGIKDLVATFEVDTDDEGEPQLRVSGRYYPQKHLLHLIVIGEHGEVEVQSFDFKLSKHNIEFNISISIDDFSESDRVIAILLSPGDDGTVGDGEYELNGRNFTDFSMFVQNLEGEEQGKMVSVLQNQVLEPPESDDLVVSEKVELDIGYERTKVANYIPNDVIVLGNYDGGKSEIELYDVVDAIEDQGHDAELIRNKPEAKHMSISEKVRAWTVLAPFCVMVDKKPSGHLTEYELIKQNRTVTALLRPKKSGSTWMIGEEPLVDYNYIKAFPFKNAPTEKITKAVSWAEGVLEDRMKAYDDFYEFR